MRSWLAVVALVSACAFTPGGPTDTSAPPPRGGGGTGSGSNGGPTHQPCELTDPAVELCLDFDSAAELGFDSSPGQHDATLTNVVPMTRSGAEPAAQFSETSTANIPENPGIDVTASGLFSIELWAQPTQLPEVQMPPFQLIAHDQYSLTVYPDGTVECWIGDYYADSGPSIATGPWTHVGCTFDGKTIAVYFDGSVAGCYTLDGSWSTPAPGSHGVFVGQPDVGGIDNVHVLARAISADEMCALAGQTSCNSSCPTHGT